MARHRIMEADIFLDTSYAVALASENDQHHVRAVELSLKLEILPNAFDHDLGDFA